MNGWSTHPEVAVRAQPHRSLSYTYYIFKMLSFFLFLFFFFFLPYSAGDAMMLETDIIVRGFGTDQQTNIPVHAHPPDTDSDITFEEWIDQVIQAPNKGIKLDFKCLEAVEPTLKILHQKRDMLHVPVLLNADIAVGPNSPRDPVAAKEFIETCTVNFPSATMSPGFTTGWTADTKSTYTWPMILDILYKVHSLHQPVTFPIRAVFLSTSWKLFVFLLGLKPSFSISVWSSLSDDVDMVGLVQLQKYGGKDRVYFDLPEQQMTSLKEALRTEDGMNTKDSSSEWNQDLWRIKDPHCTHYNVALLGTLGVAILCRDHISDKIHSKCLYEFTKTETHPLTISGRVRFIESTVGDSQLKVCITSCSSVTRGNATNEVISHNASETGSDATNDDRVELLELTISSRGEVQLQNLITNRSVGMTFPASTLYEFSLCNVGTHLQPTVKVRPGHDDANPNELQSTVQMELTETLELTDYASHELGVLFYKEGKAHDLIVQDFVLHS